MQHQENIYNSSTPLDKLLEKARQNAYERGLFLTDEDIEAYVRGHIEAEKKTILEARITRDPEFAAEVAAEKGVVEGICQFAQLQRPPIAAEEYTPDANEMPLLPVVEKSGLNILPIATAKRRAHLSWDGKWLAAAASIALLVATGVIYLNLRQSREIANLYQTYTGEENQMKVLQSVIANKGFTSDDTLAQAYDAFISRDYTAAWNDFAQKKQDPRAQLFMGLIEMKRNQPQNALLYLDKAQQQQERSAENKIVKIQVLAQWNMALCLLKIGDQQAAIEFLTALTQTQSYNLSTENPALYGQAMEILKKIQSRETQ